MVNRKRQPPIHTVEKVVLPPPSIHYLDNGIPVYSINAGTQEVCKIEWIFNAGRPYETKKLVARATNSQLKAGIPSASAFEIAEQLDFLGASLGLPFHMDTSNIVLYTLNRNLESALGVLSEMLIKPTFPERELQTFARLSQQNLSVELTKNDVVAYRKLTEDIFGANHPYGYNSMPENYNSLKRDDLADHHRRCYIAEHCKIIISGKIDATALRLLNQYCGEIKSGPLPDQTMPDINAPANYNVRLKGTGSLQAAIRIGRKMFNRKHPDYPGMFVLNAILGGYFGSRLMANIREDKGYTYNIYSSLDAMVHDGFFYIGAEVGNEFLQPTLKEIQLEMQRLREELVPEEELEMVRNYLLGNFLAQIDGPFQVADVLKTIIVGDLPAQFLETLVDKVKNIDAQEIKKLAEKYLQAEAMREVIVGTIT